MVASSFDPALKFTRQEEGGNDDDPRDRGGRTSRGITTSEWSEYRLKHPDLPADVWEAPETSVNDIYHSQFWNPYCDKLPSGLDLAFFDFGVNAGQKQAAICLQRALNVPADGHIGMQTMAAIEGCSDIDGLIHDFCNRRRDFYRHLKQFPIYGKDWLGRTDRCERAAIKMAGISPVMAPTVISSPRADPEDRITPTVPPEAAAGATAATGTLTGVVSRLQEDLQGFASLKAVQYVLMACVVVSAGLMIYGYWKRSRVSEAVS